MRTALWGMVIAGSTLAGWLSLGAGCGTLPADCHERFVCRYDGGAGGAPTTTGVGGDSGLPPECVPALAKGAVADSCGIFVSSSLGDDAAAKGTQATPFKTLAAAVAAAGKAKAPVYACAESFTEPVNVTAAIALFGGLDCTKDWIHIADAKATLTAAADTVPLTLSKTASSVQLVDFKVQAVDATVDGGSSIAVLADAVEASFTRCELIAGNGVKGADGMMPDVTPGPTKASDTQIVGNNGSDACSNVTMVLGGLPKENDLCGLAVNPLGGAGGIGFLTSGNNGDAAPANAQTALGGIGQKTSDPTWGCFAGSGLGDGGANGQAGMDGAGAAGMTALGQLTLAGYVGVSGLSGGAGKPGQGGGGGGAAKGKMNCGGASGGGGGTGGCGGLGGSGGKAGGASIALVSLGATLSFATVSITVGGGGAGGNGADGRSGKTGGSGGLGGVGAGTALSACRGGDGGQGGYGGKGGGGRGGHVIGIAASGTAPEAKGVTFTKGTPGLGGKGAAVSLDGDPGVEGVVQLFP